MGYTKGMGTTDQRLKAAHERGTDDTDEEKRQIPGRGFIPPFRHWGGCKAMGRIQSNLPFFIRFFISGIGVIRGRSPLFLVAAERSKVALSSCCRLWFTTAWPCRGLSCRKCQAENATAGKTVGSDV